MSTLAFVATRYTALLDVLEIALQQTMETDFYVPVSLIHFSFSDLFKAVEKYSSGFAVMKIPLLGELESWLNSC